MSSRRHPGVEPRVHGPPRHAPRARGVPRAPRTNHRRRSARRANGSATSAPPAADSAEARHWSRTTPPAADGASADPVKEEPGEGGQRRPVGGCDPRQMAPPPIRTRGPARPPATTRKRRDSADGADADGDADPEESDAEDCSSGGGSGTHNGKAADAPAPMELDADAEVGPGSCWPKSSGDCFRPTPRLTKLLPDDLARTDA